MELTSGLGRTAPLQVSSSSLLPVRTSICLVAGESLAFRGEANTTIAGGRKMIDTITENPIPLTQAAAELPRRRRGRKTHVSTLYRWATGGCRGVVLETIQIGGTRCTSREAMQRFFERLSVPIQTRADHGGHPAPLAARTAAERQRQAADAGRKLAEMGA